MKKIILGLALLFGACYNFQTNQVSNSVVREITEVSTEKKYENRDGVLYVDDALVNGSHTYKKSNGVVVKGNYKNGLPEGRQEKYYPNGKLFSKENIVDGKYQGEQVMYYENGNKLSEVFYNDGKESSGKIYYEDGKLLFNMEGRNKGVIYYKNGKTLFTMEKTNIGIFNENGTEAFTVSPDGVKIKGQEAKKTLLDIFSSKEKALMTALSFLMTNDIVSAEYKSGKKSVDLEGTTVKAYYENGSPMLEVSGSLDGTISTKIYYENAKLMSDGTRVKSSEITAKTYDKNGNLLDDMKISKDRTVKKLF